MTLRARCQQTIASLPPGIFPSEEEAWSALQAVVLGYNVNIEIDAGDERVDLLKDWLTRVMPERSRHEVMVIAGDQCGYRKPPETEAYQAAVREMIWGRKFSHVYLGRVSQEYAQLFSVNQAPTIGIKTLPQSDDGKARAKLVSHCFGALRPISEKDDSAWREASQGRIYFDSAERSMLASLIAMNVAAHRANYHHLLVTGCLWRRLYQWMNAAAFADGRHSLYLGDFLSIRHFMHADWIDYATNYWSAEHDPEHYPVVEPLLAALRKVRPQEKEPYTDSETGRGLKDE
jgi:hypothetical protein